MGAYVSVDKGRVVLASDVVAILAEKRKSSRSKIVFKDGSCHNSRSSPKKLMERMNGGKTTSGKAG